MGEKVLKGIKENYGKGGKWEEGAKGNERERINVLSRKVFRQEF